MNPNTYSLSISEKEKKILYELSLNARESFSNIAKDLKLSRQVVSYSVEALEKKGVIESYYAILNINRLGFLYHRVFFKFRNVDHVKEQAIINFCSRNKKIGWVVQHHGDWDLGIAVWSKNAIEFEGVLDDILEKYGNYIDEKIISVSTTIHHLKHKFLLNKKSQKDLVLGGETHSVDIDQTDYDILGILSKTARKTFIEISEQLSLTPNVVKGRIEKLHKNRVILGYNLKLNHRLLGYTHIKVFLQLNRNKESIQKLIAYLKNLIETIYITRAIGIADLEFELFVKSNEEFYDCMKKLKLALPNTIRSHSWLIIHYEPYINYLPIKK